MSAEEMRQFCQSISPFGLRVEIRLKNGSDLVSGKITTVDRDSFSLMTDAQETMSLRYVWVARIKNA
jgi:small nuclear ribonucleoprotein (snRNP)-like protein